MSITEKLTAEIYSKKKKKMDSPVYLSDTSIIPDSSKCFSQKTLPGCQPSRLLAGHVG